MAEKSFKYQVNLNYFYFVVSESVWGAPHINNRTMLLPPSPLMTQLQDIDGAVFCDTPCQVGTACECVNVIDIPLGDSVEVLLAHQGKYTIRLYLAAIFVILIVRLALLVNVSM